MSQPGPGRLLACASQVGVLMELRRLLEAHGHEVGGHLLDSPDPDGLAGYRLVVLDGSGQTASGLALCTRLRRRLEDSFIPVLFVTDDTHPTTRLACFEAGA